MKYTFIIILLIILVNLGSSQKNSGNFGLSYLKIAIDARAVGMGEAYCAAANDAAAVYWNPAGLANSNHSNVFFNHNEWIEDIRGEFASMVLKSGKSAWALSVRSFSIDDIDVRMFPSETPLEKTSANYWSAGISYSRRIQSNISMGLTVKYLFEKIYTESAFGFASDLGITYRNIISNLSLAATLQNLGKLNNFQDEASELPIIFRFGFYYNMPLSGENFDINIAADLVKTSGDKTHLHLGSELVFFKQLAIRGGYLNGYDSREFNMGAGILRSTLRMDYAITPFNQNLGVAHRFCVAFNI
jgi:hypothetical protein